jgi:hypothetical protein
LTIHDLCSMSILKICDYYNFAPIWLWQICMVEHVKFDFKQTLIFPFKYPILFRNVGVVNWYWMSLSTHKIVKSFKICSFCCHFPKF